MYEIVFEYKDKYTKGKYNKQKCICSGLDECIKMYGLGYDCEYNIISIKEV